MGDEINRLKNMMARGQFDAFKGRSESKGTISLSGIQLPLKSDFVKMLLNPGHGGDDYVHYFVCLVMYRSQVIATQMLSTLDGINRSGHLEFPKLIIRSMDYRPQKKSFHIVTSITSNDKKSLFTAWSPRKRTSLKILFLPTLSII